LIEFKGTTAEIGNKFFAGIVGATLTYINGAGPNEVLVFSTDTVGG